MDSLALLLVAEKKNDVVVVSFEVHGNGRSIDVHYARNTLSTDAQTNYE
jgi:hypothetical protein